MYATPASISSDAGAGDVFDRLAAAIDEPRDVRPRRVGQRQRICRRHERAGVPFVPAGTGIRIERPAVRKSPVSSQPGVRRQVSRSEVPATPCRKDTADDTQARPPAGAAHEHIVQANGGRRETALLLIVPNHRGESISFEPCFETIGEPNPKQGREERSRLARALLPLNSRFDLQPSFADGGAGIGKTRPVRVDEIWRLCKRRYGACGEKDSEERDSDDVTPKGFYSFSETRPSTFRAPRSAQRRMPATTSPY
jgi:hypothetical protein